MALRPLLSTKMATITFSDVGKEAVKEAKEAVRFLFAHKDFELQSNGSVETDDPEVVAGAVAHPWLNVESVASDEQRKSAEAQAAEVSNSTDPHVNPAADHLSDQADPAVVEAARGESPVTKPSEPVPPQRQLALRDSSTDEGENE